MPTAYRHISQTQLVLPAWVPRLRGPACLLAAWNSNKAVVSDESLKDRAVALHGDGAGDGLAQQAPMRKGDSKAGKSSLELSSSKHQQVSRCYAWCSAGCSIVQPAWGGQQGGQGQPGAGGRQPACMCQAFLCLAPLVCCPVMLVCLLLKLF